MGAGLVGGLSSQTWYLLLLAAVAAERVAELAVSRRNTRWSLANGGVESGRQHYPALVALHTALLLGCLAEVRLADRPFVPAVGWPMLALVAAAQAGRWWCVGTLGRQWNTRVIVVPGMPRVTTGPYRWLRHPNYVVVAVEGIALPMVHDAWLTALVFTVCNAALLGIRLRCEESALAGAPELPARPSRPG
ncbi:isoprenylcysteine carboxyl methyltransferase family protein [Streptomyces iconiensis]|uniref:Isoprenylcysteine carboxyl methyltransferase family protein n=1 Tax=Streptomyces iconiensis TaxID=1384038 RepID=A0ABT6ZV83_9ACTN|nr:isoprenylcysteine carboxyl methyltransferase family protein [Streptomyces iconiensis]MDJ1132977.1 isoprenylcysteine carboxyl methyltransferase family protein [Streptomyces iconiensis]